MGKVQKPLTIFVLIPGWQHLPWVKDLQAKGHKVNDGPTHEDQDIWDADLILGPTCARFIPGMEKFLESFIKGARAIKYKGKKDD